MYTGGRTTLQCVAMGQGREDIYGRKDNTSMCSHGTREGGCIREEGQHFNVQPWDKGGRMYTGGRTTLQCAAMGQGREDVYGRKDNTSMCSHGTREGGCIWRKDNTSMCSHGTREGGCIQEEGQHFNVQPWDKGGRMYMGRRTTLQCAAMGQGSEDVYGTKDNTSMCSHGTREGGCIREEGQHFNVQPCDKGGRMYTGGRTTLQCAAMGQGREDVYGRKDNTSMCSHGTREGGCIREEGQHFNVQPWDKGGRMYMGGRTTLQCAAMGQGREDVYGRKDNTSMCSHATREGGCIREEGQHFNVQPWDKGGRIIREEGQHFNVQPWDKGGRMYTGGRTTLQCAAMGQGREDYTGGRTTLQCAAMGQGREDVYGRKDNTSMCSHGTREGGCIREEGQHFNVQPWDKGGRMYTGGRITLQCAAMGQGGRMYMGGRTTLQCAAMGQGREDVYGRKDNTSMCSHGTREGGCIWEEGQHFNVQPWDKGGRMYMGGRTTLQWATMGQGREDVYGRKDNTSMCSHGTREGGCIWEEGQHFNVQPWDKGGRMYMGGRTTLQCAAMGQGREDVYERKDGRTTLLCAAMGQGREDVYGRKDNTSMCSHGKKEKKKVKPIDQRK